MPKWLIIVSNIAVIAILYAIASFFRWAGAEFAFGFVVGFFTCYAIFKCWKQDYAMERDPHFKE